MVEEGMQLAIKQQQYNVANSEQQLESVLRRKREYYLVLVCMIALVYSLPVTDISRESNINIPAISLNLSIEYALILFPTVIAAFYLTYISSAIRHSTTQWHAANLKQQLNAMEKGESLKAFSHYQDAFGVPLRFILLPLPLHPGGYSVLKTSRFAKKCVDYFVGFVFNGFPYLAVGYVVVKSFNLLDNKVLLAWNLLCITVMLLAFVSTIFSQKRRPQ